MGKKSSFFDWLLYFAFCVIITFIPIVYLRKLLKEGSLVLEFELYDTNEIVYYLWFTFFLIIFLPTFIVAVKSFRIKKMNREIDSLNEHLKIKEKEFEDKLNYYEEEKKVAIGFDKQKLTNIEQKYESEFLNLKKQLSILTKENDELKKLQSNGNYLSSPKPLVEDFFKYKSETKNYLRDIQTKLNQLNQVIEFQNDFKIFEQKEDFFELASTKLTNQNNNVYMFYSNDNFDNLYRLVTKDLNRADIQIVFTGYYEKQIVEFLNYLFINNLSNIKVSFLDEPEYDFLLIENDSLFINAFNDRSLVFHYFNPNGVNLILDSLSSKYKSNFEIVTGQLIEVFKKEDAVILKFLNESYILADEKINKFTVKMQNNLKKEITFISLKVSSNEFYFVDEIEKSKSEIPF